MRSLGITIASLTLWIGIALGGATAQATVTILEPADGQRFTERVCAIPPCTARFDLRAQIDPPPSRSNASC